MSAVLSEGVRCEKCGRDDVLIRWHGEGAYHPSRGRGACWSDYGERRGKPREEHLHYHCRTCQFDWAGPLTPSTGGRGAAASETDGPKSEPGGDA